MMVDFVGVMNKVTGVTSLGFGVTVSNCLEGRGYKEKPQSSKIEDWGVVRLRKIGGCG
jgi:hypothetical protein